MRSIQMRHGAKLIIFASFFAASFASAGDMKWYGDWFTGTAHDGSFASAVTINLDGDSIGESCYADKHCEWRFSTKNLACDPGIKTIVLLNAKTGTKAVATECMGRLTTGAWTSKILDWSNFESVVENNQEVGFAVAAHGTTTRVIRFSLNGMKAATASIGGTVRAGAATATRRS